MKTNELNTIQVRSGGLFSYTDPAPGSILLSDIAFALSHEPRFSGHCRTTWTVAQHSIFVAALVRHYIADHRPDLIVERFAAYALEGLMHDAHEAYVKDIPSPLKALLPDYRAIEGVVENAVRAKFELDVKKPDIVKLCDRRAYIIERDILMAPLPPHPENEIFDPLRKRYPDDGRKFGSIVHSLIHERKVQGPGHIARRFESEVRAHAQRAGKRWAR